MTLFDDRRNKRAMKGSLARANGERGDLSHKISTNKRHAKKKFKESMHSVKIER